jgi:branched-subunit amino acid aminotransferase/4-amino-4-deoxychorismate lyase
MQVRLTVSADDTSPLDSTFTTLRWDGGGRIALFEHHLRRLQDHAGRLGLAWPDGTEGAARKAAFEAIHNSLNSPPEEPEEPSVGLLRLRLDGAGNFSAKARWIPAYPDPLKATAVEAPRWKEGVTGTKHGDWGPYREAARLAAERGSDLALLVDGEVVLDCCRATPLLLDDDGTAWYPDPALGSVDSVTLAAARPHLEVLGIPLSAGRLTKTLLSRARSLVAFGSGVGAIRVASLDGQSVGDGSSEFPDECAAAVESAFADSWLDVSRVSE